MNADRHILGIVQARMSSERLPGKVLMPFLGKSIIGMHVYRLSKSRHISQLVVATTDSQADDEFAATLTRQGITVFRGSEADVLDRYAKCATQFGADLVVRTTADCPLIDPNHVDRMIELFVCAEGNPRHGAISLAHVPRGFDVEICTATALKDAARVATDPYDREHVTPFLYRNVSSGSSIQYVPDISAGDFRLCIDEPRDYEMIETLGSRFGDGLGDACLESIISFLRKNPDVAEINAAVTQRRP